MSSMGNKILDVQEDIVELFNKGKSQVEVEEIIAEMHGELYRGEVASLLEEGYNR